MPIAVLAMRLSEVFPLKPEDRDAAHHVPRGDSYNMHSKAVAKICSTCEYLNEFSQMLVRNNGTYVNTIVSRFFPSRTTL